MTDNKIIGAFKRLLTMTLALVMVLGSAMPLVTQEVSAFNGKVGSKYTVHWYKELHYGPGEGGYSNAAKCDLGDDLGSRFSICVQPNKSSPVWSGDQTRNVQVDKVVTDATDTGKWNALRNIVYYSPSYPGFKKNIEGIKQFYYGDEAKDYGVAHLALAYVYAGRPNDMATWGGTHASACGDVWTRAKALANALYDTNAGDIDEDEDADTARKQNLFDDLLEAKDIKTADLEKRSQDILHGVWFGTGEFGDKAEMNSKFGALPYDSYILEEMPCEHNEGYILQKFFFTVDQKSQNGFVDLETITDDVPEIGTTASINGKNKDIRPQKEITLVDVIEYKNLKKGETYTAKGVLMDKATKKPVLDINGNQITAEQEFKTFMSNGKVKVTFTFDGTEAAAMEDQDKRSTVHSA